ncbi:MAG: hypothetical protein GY796_07260 [Chloroflexi bacterium]|nr:hypothetical protein [Chloroflexota bacterium]
MDDFSDLRDDDFDLDNPDFSSAPDFGEQDEFDQLRDQSARSETFFDDLATDDELNESSSGSSFSMSNFSSGQRLILALLVVLNIFMIGFGFLVLLGIFGG